MEQEQGLLNKKVWDSVKLYAVRCANCCKWRLIPTKEVYEEIRERIEEQPFLCETARQWRPQISCNDKPDVEQDGSMVWAMDRPRIPKTPPGWQRILRIRAEGGTKFSDVYYVAPSNKRLRSKVELSRYINENSKYLQEGLRMSQFSFQPPMPLNEKYIAKHQARSNIHDMSSSTPAVGLDRALSIHTNYSRGGDAKTSMAKCKAHVHN